MTGTRRYVGHGSNRTVNLRHGIRYGDGNDNKTKKLGYNLTQR